METSHKERGDQGEDLAWSYLRAHGHKILERNYACDFGEIDLVTLHGDWLHFVEVKARNNDELGPAIEAITDTKKSRLRKTADHYLSTQRISKAWMPCFSVVAIDNMDEDPQLEWVPNAFE